MFGISISQSCIGGLNGSRISIGFPMIFSFLIHIHLRKRCFTLFTPYFSSHYYYCGMLSYINSIEKITIIVGFHKVRYAGYLINRAREGAMFTIFILFYMALKKSIGRIYQGHLPGNSLMERPSYIGNPQSGNRSPIGIKTIYPNLKRNSRKPLLLYMPHPIRGSTSGMILIPNVM